MKAYRCPLCGSKLPKNQFERVMHIEEEKEKARKQEVAKTEKLLRQARDAETSLKSKLRESKRKERQARTEGARAGARIEKQRQERLTLGLKNKLALAKSRIEQLEKGTTPQTQGLEFEDVLWKRLKKEFPEDRVEHKGKGGDILQFVVFRKDVAGIIVYECKQTPKILPAHVQQAATAKKAREAHFAILVTTGTRKGFTGLAQEDSVLIVAPLGVIPLARLCRAHLIEMAKAKLDNEQKNRVATQLLGFITSPTYRIPLEQVMQQARKVQDLLRREAKEHLHIWRERWAIYQTIELDVKAVQTNVNRVLEGDKPLPLERRRVEPLQLPAITEK